MSSAVEERELSVDYRERLYGGTMLSPSTMKLDFKVRARGIYVHNPPMIGDKLDEEAILNDDSIEFLDPIRVHPIVTHITSTVEDDVDVEVSRSFSIDIDFPPGGEAILKDGGKVTLQNTIDPMWYDWKAYSFCPKCKNWWLKRTSGRPKRCPECNARLDKYKLEEIELKEVMKQGKKIL